MVQRGWAGETACPTRHTRGLNKDPLQIYAD
jgi:hypothetical protein